MSEVIGEEATTIHQLLKLKPTLDILELDFNDLQFTSSKNVDI
jgi:hypothetical protein